MEDTKDTRSLLERLAQDGIRVHAQQTVDPDLLEEIGERLYRDGSTVEENFAEVYQAASEVGDSTNGRYLNHEGNVLHLEQNGKQKSITVNPQY